MYKKIFVKTAALLFLALMKRISKRCAFLWSSHDRLESLALLPKIGTQRGTSHLHQVTREQNRIHESRFPMDNNKMCGQITAYRIPRAHKASLMNNTQH